MKVKSSISYLPRGGCLVPTSVGYIQFGSPPETIKDTMLLIDKVPLIFVLPGELFNFEKGITVAELEFPIYHNYFLSDKKTLIICTQEQKKQMEAVLQESVLGPERIDLCSEFKNGNQSLAYPDLRSEMNYFQGKRKLSDLVEFGIFKDEMYQINSVKIYRRSSHAFLLQEGKNISYEIPWTIQYPNKYELDSQTENFFEAPQFGMTCLGPSHGFDPHDNTSGFIFWVNGRGIMIDPPVNSMEWLRDENVNPKLIGHVILTHCHADHDAGTFQKILEEEMITIHTTETIMHSFIRKYTALTKLPHKKLYELFNFNPLLLDAPNYIEGAEFLFHYTLHAIPTIGFRASYRNQSLVYSSDHLNNPKIFKKLKKMKIITQERYNFLMDFPWHYDVIYHEAGIPPIHTSVSFLASLPKEIQKRIIVYHIAKRDFPKNTDLKIAKFGVENTFSVPIQKLKYEEAISLLDVMSHLDLFAEFPLNKVREFLEVVEKKTYKRGDKIIAKGDTGNTFYIIANGLVRVEGVGSELKKTYGKYEYFGETSLITGAPRAGDVYAQTDVTILTMMGKKFLHFIQGTKVESILKKLAKTRDTNSWDLLSRSWVFSQMTSYQKTQLESIMIPVEPKDTNLFVQGKAPHSAFILHDGIVELFKDNRSLGILESGDFIGDIFSLQKGKPMPFTARAHFQIRAYQIGQKEITSFIQKNPGVYMRLLRAQETLLS